MCGIAGIYAYKTGRPVTSERIKSMTDVMAYRGPDADGLFIEANLGLGHRRLSILDVHSRSTQPMSSADGKHHICYNGEVYNYLELRQSLAIAEYRTSSDTEVMLHALMQKGLSAVQDFNGMFAFAYWDSTSQELYLVRDRLGIKPLYYVETADGIVFASEMESLLKGLDNRPSLNRTMIPTYLRMGYVPGEQTMMQEVKRLLPGHWMKVHPSYGIKIEKYWDLTFQRSQRTNQHKKSEHELLEELRHLMLDATKLQLRSDVPLGVFLSGGVDSSAVVAMMHQLGIEKKSTFSVAWDLGPEFDETRYAREVAQQFNAEHHEYWMSAQDFVDFLPQWIRHMGEPVTEAAAVSLYYIAQKARQDVTVVLSGEGADEVFGGYPIYGYFQWLHRYASLPTSIRALLDPCISALGPKWRKYVDISRQSLRSSYCGVSFYPESEFDWLLTPHARAEFNDNRQKAHYFLNQCYDGVQKEDVQTQMQYVDVKSWLVDDLLIKADRMSMAASLELRVPFLDHRLMEWAAALPSSYRLKNGETKYLLKKALEPWLPRSVLYRKKQGFPTPLKVLFRGELSNWVRDLLLSSQCLNRGFFDSEKIKIMLTEHQNNKRDWHRVLWLLAVFELWNQNYLDN